MMRVNVLSKLKGRRTVCGVDENNDFSLEAFSAGLDYISGRIVVITRQLQIGDFPRSGRPRFGKIHCRGTPVTEAVIPRVKVWHQVVWHLAIPYESAHLRQRD